jgi:hypothetical protein
VQQLLLARAGAGGDGPADPALELDEVLVASRQGT